MEAKGQIFLSDSEEKKQIAAIGYLPLPSSDFDTMYNVCTYLPGWLRASVMTYRYMVNQLVIHWVH